jgi:hypothetical protein
MTTVEAVGSAAMIADLTEAGYTVSVVGDIAIFSYAIEVGSRAGEAVRVGLPLLGDWPMSAPHGPHVSPRIGHPHGGVSDSPLGSDWEQWSRPIPDWVGARTMSAYLRHLRTLFAQL